VGSNPTLSAKQHGKSHRKVAFSFSFSVLICKASVCRRDVDRFGVPGAVLRTGPREHE
jgi:hypothetical protein